ncbi:MAG: hypothetical protein NWE92_00205 [Candidatus Bathyarchaeota archaeon]|nr:hypothetical protein [Candidatus Bathyarchaeota archaeon]
MPQTIRYQFTQVFSVSAKEAFDWCTNFDAADNTLMGDTDAKREIIKVADGVILLTDTFTTSAGAIVKQKLVTLYPQSLFWVSTHLSGPHRHSQFLYQITPLSKDTSMLTFTAAHIEYDKDADPAALSEELCEADAQAWKLLAAAMEKELKKR